MSVARVARKIGFASVSFPPRRQNSPLAMQETVDSNTRADLRIDFITKSCDNDS